MIECTMRLQRRRFREAVFVRSDYDGIAFPAGASSAEAMAAVSFWVKQPDFQNVQGAISERLYLLVTRADSRTGKPVRFLYHVTDSGLQEAFGGELQDGDVTFVWDGFETGQMRYTLGTERRSA